jgi:hypothetical protein
MRAQKGGCADGSHWPVARRLCSTTKGHAVVDTSGNPVRFTLTGGSEADCTQALPFLARIQTGAVIQATALAVIRPKQP